MSIRRRSATVLAAGLLALTVAGTATAHECVIASRSDQGDASAAAHAKVWGTLTLTDVFAFLPGEVGGPALTPAQLQWALDEAARQGLPSSWTIRNDKTIGEGSQNPNLANGKGLDHLVDAVGEQIVGIYFAALGH
jgi:hypothetical protein